MFLIGHYLELGGCRQCRLHTSALGACSAGGGGSAKGGAAGVTALRVPAAYLFTTCVRPIDPICKPAGCAPAVISGNGEGALRSGISSYLGMHPSMSEAANAVPECLPAVRASGVCGLRQRKFCSANSLQTTQRSFVSFLEDRTQTAPYPRATRTD